MRDDTLGMYNTADLREAARRRLPKGLFELRKLWPRKLIVKGIQHPHDAVLAAKCGADTVVRPV